MTIRSGLFTTLLALILVSAASCCIVDQERLNPDDLENKPWNEPSDWEHRVPGT